MAVNKKGRFEVFKRDSFTCQYCGQSAPDVVLHVDHIVPVSEGGGDDITNLITSCQDCNLGKGNRLLSDDAVVKQRKRQLDDLQERREQLEMMMEWQRGLIDLEEQAITELADLWDCLVPGYHLNEFGLVNLKKWARKFSVQELIYAMKAAATQYLKHQNPGDEFPTQESVDKAWRYVPRICRSRRRQEEKPYLKELYYARGILRNRFNYVNEWEALQLMESAYLAGHSIEEIQTFCKKARNWTCFRQTMEDWGQEDADG